MRSQIVVNPENCNVMMEPVYPIAGESQTGRFHGAGYWVFGPGTVGRLCFQMGCGSIQTDVLKDSLQVRSRGI